MAHILSCIQYIGPTPAAEKYPHNIIDPPPCLIVCVHLGSNSAFRGLRTKALPSQPNKYTFFSSDHRTLFQFPHLHLCKFNPLIYIFFFCLITELFLHYLQLGLFSDVIFEFCNLLLVHFLTF